MSEFVRDASKQIMAGLLANPNIVGYDPGCGWSPVNTTWFDLADFAVHLAQKLEDANACQPTTGEPVKEGA